MKLNNKGFTLIEVLAVIVIIAIIGGIAIPNVLSTINNSKDVAEKIMIENIKIAAQQLYEEVEFAGTTPGTELYNYKEDGTKDTIIKIHDNTITVNLQTLVSNGFLKVTSEDNKKIIKNPKTGENIGECQIIITKEVDKDSNYKTTYTFTNDSVGNTKCPNYS